MSPVIRYNEFPLYTVGGLGGWVGLGFTIDNTVGGQRTAGNHSQHYTCTVHIQYSTYTVQCIYSTVHIQYSTYTVQYIYSTVHIQYSTYTVQYIYSTVHIQYSTYTVQYIYSTVHIQYVYALYCMYVYCVHEITPQRSWLPGYV